MNRFENWAIFLPGLVHGAENEVYLVSLNPDSTCGYDDGQAHPSWDIGHITADVILSLAEESKTADGYDAEVFVLDFFEGLSGEGRWYWAEANTSDPADYSHFYDDAAFIIGKHGDESDAIKFLIAWATAYSEGKPFDCPRAKFVVETEHKRISVEQRNKAEQVLIDNGIDPDEADVVLQAIGYVLLNEELYPESEVDS